MPGTVNNRIQLAAFLERSLANGPGLRAVVWLQGCHRRCPGCFNPGMLDFAGGSATTVVAVAERILAVDDIEGVTFSGGEPLEQAAELALLAELLREKGLNVVLFTGYSGAELAALAAPGQRRLLATVDLAVAGAYRQDLPSQRYLCGSDNQEVLFLSERLRRHPDVLNDQNVVGEFIIGADGQIRVSGLLGR